MLSKINHHPLLCNDPDFVMFLTSQDFVNESKERERLSGSGASLQNSEYLDGNKDVAMSSMLQLQQLLLLPLQVDL